MCNITKVKKIAKVINTLVTSKFGVVVTVGGSTAYSAGGRINIPFGDFSDPKFMRMCHGFIDHETGHEAETKHELMAQMRARYQDFGGSILNALEDARMELKQAQRFPGAKINLENLWKDMIELQQIINPFEMAEIGRVVFSYVNNTARKLVCGYANNYSAEGYEILAQNLGKPFADQLTNLIAQAVQAKSTDDVFNISCAICELLKQEQTKPQSNDTSDSDTDDESEDDSEGTGDAESESDTDDESEDDSEGTGDAESESGTDDESQDDSEGTDDAEGESGTDDESEDDSEGTGDAESESGTDDESEDDSEGTDDTESESGTDDESEDDSEGTDDAEGESGTDDESEDDSEGTDDAEGESGADDESEGDSEGTVDAKSSRNLSGDVTDIEYQDYHQQVAELLSEMAIDDQDEVAEFSGYDIDVTSEPFKKSAPVEGWKALSSKFARTLQRVIIDNSESLKMGANSGRKLMDRSIAQIPAGKKNVFEFKEENEAPVSSVELLVDASGSMDGRKMIEANKTALAFAKAFQRMGIDIEVNYFGVYDYERNKNTIYQAKRFGERLKPENFSVGASGSTPTHDALFFGLTRIVNQQSDNKIIIVVTDGQPDESSFLVDTVEMTKNTGVKIVPIGLGTQRVRGFTDSVYAETSEDVNIALKQAIKLKLF
jgi:cobaltochelatase CobT